MDRQTLYHMNGEGNYWVVSRAGYDLAAFTTREEAQAEYDRLVTAERFKSAPSATTPG